MMVFVGHPPLGNTKSTAMLKTLTGFGLSSSVFSTVPVAGSTTVSPSADSTVLPAGSYGRGSASCHADGRMCRRDPTVSLSAALFGNPSASPGDIFFAHMNALNSLVGPRAKRVHDCLWRKAQLFACRIVRWPLCIGCWCSNPRRLPGRAPSAYWSTSCL